MRAQPQPASGASAASSGPSSHRASAALTRPEKRSLIAAVADNALASFVVVHAALKRSARLARYAGRSDLEARLGAGYRVAMGFGLHVGWAIEGAIGARAGGGARARGRGGGRGAAPRGVQGPAWLWGPGCVQPVASQRGHLGPTPAFRAA